MIKNKFMKLTMLADRAQAIKKFIKEVRISEPDEQGLIEIEFDKVDEFTLLRLFSAGVEYGFNSVKDAILKS